MSGGVSIWLPVIRLNCRKPRSAGSTGQFPLPISTLRTSLEKTMLKIIAIVAVVIAVLLIGLLAYAASKQDIFRVQRATSIQAPAEKIFPLINDLHSFNTWNPYDKKDSAMKRSYSGPASGKGAAFAWNGNQDIGEGRMEISDSTPASSVKLNLDFVRPFQCHNLVEFTLEPQGDATRVTWAMHGPQPFFNKIVSVFINMDRMIGADFEAGLANLKAIAEK